MISQKLAEAAEGTRSTRFEDIVPKPYQEFKDVFAKDSFDKLPDHKKWDHAIELIPDACLARRCTLWRQSSRNSWTSSLKRTLRADVYTHPNHPWPLLSSSLRKRTEASASFRTTVSLMC